MNLSDSMRETEIAECEVCGRMRSAYAQVRGYSLCSLRCVEAQRKIVEIKTQRMYEIQNKMSSHE